MIRKLTVWIAALTVGVLMMAVVLADAAHAQGKAEPEMEREVTVDGGAAPLYGSLLAPRACWPPPGPTRNSSSCRA